MLTSRTKRTFEDIHKKVLRDATAGSVDKPLRISGASLAGNSVYSWVLPSITLHLLSLHTTV